MKKLTKVLSSSLLVVLLAGVFLFAFPGNNVHAEGLNDDPPVNGEKLGNLTHRLEAAFERQLANLDRQANNIQKMSLLAGKAQERIEALMTKGKDVTALEAALAIFEGKIVDINAAHQMAAELIAAHSGFDNNGKVSGIVAAKNTLQNVHDALKNTRRMMSESIRELRQTLRGFREANAAVPTTQP